MKKILRLIFFVILIFITFSSNCVALASKPKVSTDNLSIYSDSVLLIEKESCDILYEKNAYQKMYPASTTKILTAIVVLENSYLNERVTVSQSALSSVPSSYTVADLEVR